MVLMVGSMFLYQPWKTDVMLPVTHTGAAQGCRTSSRRWFLCSHPDLAERLSLQKKSRAGEKSETAAKTDATSSPRGWIPASHPPRSPCKVPRWLLDLSRDRGTLSSLRVHQLRARWLAAPPSKGGMGHLFHLFPPTEIPPGEWGEESGTGTTTDQDLAFPVSSTGKTHAVGKSMMSRLVSPQKQPDPPAGGCFVFPQGTISSSLQRGILLPATRNSTGPSLAQKTGSNETLAVGSGYAGTEPGEKEN